MTNSVKRGLCKQCNHIKPISKAKLCRDCSINNQLEQQKQLIAKKGPYYDQWRQKTAASLKKA